MDDLGLIFAPILLIVVSVLPWVLALTSNKVHGNQKLIWFFMSFFMSWLGFFVYYFVVVKSLPKRGY